MLQNVQNITKTIGSDIAWTKSIYLYTYKSLIILIDCLLEAVRTNPGYGMATLIYNNLLNLILGTAMLLRSNYIIQEKDTSVFIKVTFNIIDSENLAIQNLDLI